MAGAHVQNTSSRACLLIITTTACIERMCCGAAGTRQVPAPAPSMGMPTQLFLLLTNLSTSPTSAPAASPSQRKLLQALPEPADSILFTALVVPRPPGAPLFATAPTDPAYLLFQGHAASGSVALYDHGTEFAQMSILNGRGSLQLLQTRSRRHFFTSNFLGAPGFAPNVAASVTVLPDGAIQPAAEPPAPQPDNSVSAHLKHVLTAQLVICVAWLCCLLP